MNAPAYLDYNATAPLRPAVIEAMADSLGLVGNPSSVHRFGRTARRRVETAREQVAALVGAAPEAVVFVSGGTEANILALRGCRRERVLVSAVEHESVRRAVAGAEVIPVDCDGRVDPARVAAMLAADSRPAVVSVMFANNETGVVQPIAAIAEAARAHGALLHVDAAQAAGKMAFTLAELGADMLTLSAHKLGGPQGVGALALADDALDLVPQFVGGGQERRRRAGTENVAGIVGFGVAAMLADPAEMERVRALRDGLERGVRGLAPTARIFAAGVERLPNTTCLALPGLASEVQVMALDLAGVAVSAGAACSSGKVQPSHVLGAMGVEPALAGCAIRASLGWRSEARDMERFLEAWGALARRAGASVGAASAA